MRGVIFGSLLLGFLACVPAQKPAADPSSSDDSTSGNKSDTPAETWGSSETAASASTPPFSSTHSSPTAASPSPGATTAVTASEPKAATDPGPHVPTSLGEASYDRETLEVALKRAARQVKANCGAATDDSGSASGPWGKTTVTVKLGHNGHSKAVSIPAPFDGKPTGRCAVQAFSNLTYAPFAGSDTDVDWPVDITKP